MAYERQYVESLMKGDTATMRAIERLHRNDYSLDKFGYQQAQRDRTRAIWGSAYTGFHESPAGIPSFWKK